VRRDAVQVALQRRLEAVDQEIADLQSLLRFMRRMERDAVLRERLRSSDLGFRLQDLWSGRITGEPLRRALDALEGVAAPAVWRPPLPGGS
jgi:hypothetical protein